MNRLDRITVLFATLALSGAVALACTPRDPGSDDARARDTWGTCRDPSSPLRWPDCNDPTSPPHLPDPPGVVAYSLDGALSAYGPDPYASPDGVPERPAFEHCGGVGLDGGVLWCVPAPLDLPACRLMAALTEHPELVTTRCMVPGPWR